MAASQQAMALGRPINAVSQEFEVGSSPKLAYLAGQRFQLRAVRGLHRFDLSHVIPDLHDVVTENADVFGV
jgi:hypothetical protein